MTALLVVLTVLEIAIVIVVLAIYVVLITRRLRTISSYLAKIAFGVRAVDSQTAGIEPHTGRINAGLRQLEDLLGVKSSAPGGG